MSSGVICNRSMYSTSTFATREVFIPIQCRRAIIARLADARAQLAEKEPVGPHPGSPYSAMDSVERPATMMWSSTSDSADLNVCVIASSARDASALPDGWLCTLCGTIRHAPHRIGNCGALRAASPAGTKHARHQASPSTVSKSKAACLASQARQAFECRVPLRSALVDRCQQWVIGKTGNLAAAHFEVDPHNVATFGSFVGRFCQLVSASKPTDVR